MKHLSNKSFFITFLIALVFTYGCEKKKVKEKYVAKVNNVYLTESDLNSILTSKQQIHLTKQEVIRNWVTDELLFQEAVKEGITKGKDYRQMIKNSERKIAGSLLVKNVILSDKQNISDDKLENFYFQHKDDFKLFNYATLLNKISFNEEDKAILFRKTVLKSNWDKAVRIFMNDSTVLDNKSDQLLYDYQIQPKLLLRVVKGLNKNEVSLILHYSENAYQVVQVKEKFRKGSTPPFTLIKEKVSEMYLAQKQKSLIQNYLDNLRLSNDIEIIN